MHIYIHPTAQKAAYVALLQKQTRRVAIVKGHRVELVPSPFITGPRGPHGGAAA